MLSSVHPLSILPYPLAIISLSSFHPIAILCSSYNHPDLSFSFPHAILQLSSIHPIAILTYPIAIIMLSFSYPNLSSRHPIVLYMKHMVKFWKNCKYKISFVKKLWLCFRFCEKTTSMILVLWKNVEYDFLKMVIFPLKPM